MSHSRPPATPSILARLGASRIAHGDLGFLPVVFGLVVIALVFYNLTPVFLTPRNASNLVLQLGPLTLLTMGMVLVLLIGEIDLSAGSVAGCAAVVLVVLLTRHGWPAIGAIPAALLFGCLAGLIQGSWVVFVRAPSFIVTLTGLLVFQGLQFLLLGEEVGALLIYDPFVKGIASTYMPHWLAWCLVGLTAIIALAAALTAPVRNARRLLRLLLFPLVAAAIVAVLNLYFGVPYLLLLVIAVALALTLLTEHSLFGVHLLAVGGNAEAARRAGINVSTVRIRVFALCSTLAALAGIVAASRQYSVDSATGGGNLVLDSIAAAVIGGTSLFGGRGRIVGGLLGAVVIGSVSNGLDLLGQPAHIKTIITGLILLAAVSVDMLARRRRISSGAAGA
ncbi:sugar ABC transporter permease [Mesorhizobium sp. BR1-1-16]|uniref:sugar ABC transporter permease n=1 Tax=Mesorhizobium sp. BR1-1-16 TaxID=2876653 RepID=UPI001CCA8881|nr:sugar ABC transporter permease [Mesorhizobium sp. BR1-1-16]MBZ9936763.1 sugar ABC transporter permease [Mesorhizobium sp. BR1-1-16]